MSYPEHEKLKALEGKNEVIGDFLEWLSHKGLRVCQTHKHDESCYDSDEDEICGMWNETTLVPVNRNPEWYIAQFFEIDEKKLSDEKDAMIEEFRKGQR